MYSLLISVTQSLRRTPFKDCGASEAAQGRTKTHKGILMAMPVEGGVSGRKRLADAQGCTETHRVAQIRTKSHKISQTRTRSHRFDQKRTTLLKKLGQGYFCPKNGVIAGPERASTDTFHHSGACHILAVNRHATHALLP